MKSTKQGNETYKLRLTTPPPQTPPFTLTPASSLQKQHKIKNAYKENNTIINDFMYEPKCPKFT